MGKNKSKSNICLIVNRDLANGISPYRLVYGKDASIDEVNEYLDMLATRGLSLCTLRAYGYDLLNFWRWIFQEGLKLKDITENLLLEYIRYQRNQSTSNKDSAPTTINRRLIVARCLYHYHFDRPVSRGPRSVKKSPTPFSQKTVYSMTSLNSFRLKRRTPLVKVPSRIIIPLTRQQVAQFISTLRTWRDIAITAFMLLCGLRSKEVIDLKLDDIRITEDQVRINGKGGKERIVPLPRDLVIATRRYIQLERPKESVDSLFVILKGPHRGNSLTSAGLRAIYRYHRKTSDITNANPHRFRHTFGSTMANAGISLPALMKLMGHSYVKTTLGYINISVNDLRAEFHRVVDNLYTKEIKNGPKEED